MSTALTESWNPHDVASEFLLCHLSTLSDKHRLFKMIGEDYPNEKDIPAVVRAVVKKVKELTSIL
jgi:hypothetical protein